MRTIRSLGLVALLILGSASARGDEGSGSTVGDLKLASGPMVIYDYHYDHNAFADSVNLPGGLVALTRSGNLIRFDPETRKPTRERFGPSRITCLGRGGPDSAVVGFEDGRVARLNPATLDFTVIATLPAKPHWVGIKAGGGVVAVVERWKWADVMRGGFCIMGMPGPKDKELILKEKEAILQMSKPDRQARKAYSEVRDLASGRSFAIDSRARAVFLDSKDRVWLGFSQGEFGGWCRRIDLPSGRTTEVRGKIDPVNGGDNARGCVLGFLELRDGRVWAYGGNNDAFIRRGDGDRAEGLFEFNQDGRAFANFEAKRKLGDPMSPTDPILQIVKGREPDSLLVFTESGEVLRTDFTLRHWDEVQELETRFEEGPPGIGDTSSRLRAVHVRDEGLICATARDGYVFLADGRESREMALDQLEADAIVKIEVTSEGTFFRDRQGESSWRLKEGRWKHEAIELPVGVIFDPPMFIGQAGEIYSIGGRFTIRWAKGEMITLGGPLPLKGHSPFATPDGSLWAAKGDEHGPAALGRKDGAEERTPRGQLMQLVDGEWSKVADLPGAIGPSWQRTEYLEGGEMLIHDGLERSRTRRIDGVGFPVPMPAAGTYPIGQDLRVINEVGPPWVIHDRGEEHLLGLDYNLELKDIKLAAFPISENSLPLRVYDAISWSRKEILIATRKGMKLFDIFSRKHRPAPLPSFDRPVKFLARDGSGRLWMGGEGLWMVNEAGKLHDLAAVPMVGRSEIAALAKDPGRKDGVIVSLGERGVAFIRVEPGP